MHVHEGDSSCCFPINHGCWRLLSGVRFFGHGNRGYLSTSSVDFDRLRYGLDGFDVRDKQTLLALLSLPFRG
jgi:hypothetical protein